MINTITSVSYKLITMSQTEGTRQSFVSEEQKQILHLIPRVFHNILHRIAAFVTNDRGKLSYFVFQKERNLKLVLSIVENILDLAKHLIVIILDDILNVGQLPEVEVSLPLQTLQGQLELQQLHTQIVQHHQILRTCI